MELVTDEMYWDNWLEHEEELREAKRDPKKEKLIEDLNKEIAADRVRFVALL